MTSGLWTACLIAVAGIAVCPNAGSQETKPASETKRVWMLSLGQTRDAVVSLMGAPTNQQTADNAEALTWERKFELDVWYVHHAGPRLDWRILWMTMASVWRRDGISADGDATMPKFTGVSGRSER